MKINVLMSTYNGEKYLREQIESILNQTAEGVTLTVRDDGSTDSTKQILEEYASAGKLVWYDGENLRCTKSFWHLACNAADADYFAFCDQDDVWDSDKLEVAVKALEGYSDTPALYFCDVRVVDEKLNVISENMVEKMPVDYAHSLIKNIAPGCTYVFNAEARKLFREYDIDGYPVDIHDWLAYRIVACFGKVVFDPVSRMNYRQHGNNVIGATERGIKYYLKKVDSFLNDKNKNLRERNAQGMEACFGEKMSAENCALTRYFTQYRTDKAVKKAFLKEKSFAFSGVQYEYFKLLIKMEKI